MTDRPAGRWLPIQEAVSHFGKSERTLYRWSDAGKIETKLEDNRTLVFVPDPEPDPDKVPPEVVKLQSQVDLLQTKLDILTSQLADVQKDRENWVDVVKGLTKAVNDQQKLLMAATTKPEDWIEVNAEPMPDRKPDPVVEDRPGQPAPAPDKEEARPDPKQDQGPVIDVKPEQPPAEQKQGPAEDWRKLPWYKRLFPS